MTYVRCSGGHAVVVVRALATGREDEIDPGGGLLLHARLDEGRAWVSMDVVARDTDGDGRLSAP